MSLDVYLYRKEVCPHCGNELGEKEEIFWQNITHNLGSMAEAAGIYTALWRPHELGTLNKAVDLIPVLEKGLTDLKGDPEYFKTFNAKNGWGTYDQFVPWVEKYLEACRDYPDCYISASV